MSDLILGNGSARRISKDSDFITVGKVQAAVNLLLANDKSLDENQKRLLEAMNTLSARVETMDSSFLSLVLTVSSLEARIIALETPWWTRLWRRIRGWF